MTKTPAEGTRKPDWQRWRTARETIDQFTHDKQASLIEAIKDDSRPGFIVALLALYFSSKALDYETAGLANAAELFFGASGALSGGAIEIIDGYEEIYANKP